MRLEWKECFTSPFTLAVETEIKTPSITPAGTPPSPRARRLTIWHPGETSTERMRRLRNKDWKKKVPGEKTEQSQAWKT